MSDPLLRALVEFVLPPLGPFALLTLAFLFRRRLQRTSTVMGVVAIVWMTVFSLPGTYRWLRSPWPELPEVIGPPYPAAQAIVVLGGGRHLDAPDFGGDTASAATLERVRYAAKLHRESNLPILVSGGKRDGVGRRSEADIMRGILEQEFGRPVRWVEPDSHDTRQNARNSAKLLQADRIARVMLVTHAAHMERAQMEFEAAGVEVVPMPTVFERPEPSSIYLWIPSSYGLLKCRAWMQERLARFKPN